MHSPAQTDYEGYIEKKGWHQLFQHTAAEAGLFAHELSLPAGDTAVRRMIDIGFGSGSLLAWGRGRGWETAGVELQDSLVSAGRAAGYDVRDSTAGFAPGSFDLLTGMDVVEHMTAEQLREQLAEWRRILRPGGWVVLRTPNCQSPAGLIDQFGDGTHRQMLSGPILRDFLLRAGFEVLIVRGARNSAEFAPGLGNKVRGAVKGLLRRPARALLRLALGTGGVVLEPSILVVARRT